MDRLPGGVCGLDLDGRVTFLGVRACELLGSGPGELLGRRPWEVLPWLDDPANENAYLSALFSRLPARFSARHPRGQWLSFVLYADDRGITLRVRPIDLPEQDREREIAPTAPAGAPVRAGTLFHLLHLASALTEAVSVQEVTDSLSEQMMPVLDAQGFALLTAEEGRLHVVGSRGFPRRCPRTSRACRWPPVPKACAPSRAGPLRSTRTAPRCCARIRTWNGTETWPRTRTCR
ncbi:PAS domain-containing protein [Streptomyces mexicanus]